jgi:putative phage-type endonuclease
VIEQGSVEWKMLRAGKVTASRISDVMAKLKSGEAAVRKNYRAELVAERLSGSPAESFQSAAMRWGVEQEPLARLIYESKFIGLTVEETDFVDHPTIAMAGASPDGLVLDDGLVEFKCPNTATHIEYLLSGAAPQEYIYQMQFQMACTGRAWCDFVSFDPRMPERMQMLIVRYPRDDKMIAEIEAEVVSFNQSVADLVVALQSKFN